MIEVILFYLTIFFIAILIFYGINYIICEIINRKLIREEECSGIDVREETE